MAGGMFKEKLGIELVFGRDNGGHDGWEALGPFRSKHEEGRLKLLEKN